MTNITSTDRAAVERAQAWLGSDHQEVAARHGADGWYVVGEAGHHIAALLDLIDRLTWEAGR